MDVCSLFPSNFAGLHFFVCGRRWENDVVFTQLPSETQNARREDVMHIDLKDSNLDERTQAALDLGRLRKLVADQTKNMGNKQSKPGAPPTTAPPPTTPQHTTPNRDNRPERTSNAVQRVDSPAMSSGQPKISAIDVPAKRPHRGTFDIHPIPRKKLKTMQSSEMSSHIPARRATPGETPCITWRAAKRADDDDIDADTSPCKKLKFVERPGPSHLSTQLPSTTISHQAPGALDGTGAAAERPTDVGSDVSALKTRGEDGAGSAICALNRRRPFAFSARVSQYAQARDDPKQLRLDTDSELGLRRIGLWRGSERIPGTNMVYDNSAIHSSRESRRRMREQDALQQGSPAVVPGSRARAHYRGTFVRPIQLPPLAPPVRQPKPPLRLIRKV